MRVPICSLFALLLPLVTATAAPAPLPKTDRAKPVDQPSASHLLKELGEHGVVVKDISRVGSGWLVSFRAYRGCATGVPLQSLQIEAPDRNRALYILLERYRQEDERLIQRLRRLGVIQKEAMQIQ